MEKIQLMSGGSFEWFFQCQKRTLLIRCKPARGKSCFVYLKCFRLWEENEHLVRSFVYYLVFNLIHHFSYFLAVGRWLLMKNIIYILEYSTPKGFFNVHNSQLKPIEKKQQRETVHIFLLWSMHCRYYQELELRFYLHLK